LPIKTIFYEYYILFYLLKNETKSKIFIAVLGPTHRVRSLVH